MHPSGMPLPPADYNNAAEGQEVVGRLGGLVESLESRLYRMQLGQPVPRLGGSSVGGSGAGDEDEEGDEE